MTTEYGYVLQKGPEFEEVKEFLGDEKVETPIVVARRQAAIVGALGTKTDHGFVVAGPLEVKVKPGIFVAMKLGAMYEGLLVSWGVTQYYISLKTGVDKGWAKGIKRMGEECKVKGEYTWVKRTLGDLR